MPDSEHSFQFTPTLNVDVGGKTVWSITGPDIGTWYWFCDNPNIVTLEPSGDNNTQCTIHGRAGGQGLIWAQDKNNLYRLEQSISVGLMFVWGPDGKLYAATTSSFQLMSSEQESYLTQTIPTQAQMEHQAAYYVPPAHTESAINVTCYVINLEHIQQYDVWASSSSSQKKSSDM